MQVYNYCNWKICTLHKLPEMVNETYLAKEDIDRN